MIERAKAKKVQVMRGNVQAIFKPSKGLFNGMQLGFYRYTKSGKG